MSKTGQFFTTASPVVEKGLTVQAETRVRVGTENLYGSLTNSGDLYHEDYKFASVGLQAGKNFDLGLIDSIGFEYTNEQDEYEAGNIQKSGVYTIGTEEATVSLGVTQFDPETLRLCLSSGLFYKVGEVGVSDNEVLFTAGGGTCTSATRPIEIAAENISCGSPSLPGDTATDISAIVITVYDCLCTSGLPWSDIVANELHVLDLEFTARTVLERAPGARLFSIYIF